MSERGNYFSFKYRKGSTIAKVKKRDLFEDKILYHEISRGMKSTTTFPDSRSFLSFSQSNQIQGKEEERINKNLCKSHPLYEILKSNGSVTVSIMNCLCHAYMISFQSAQFGMKSSKRLISRYGFALYDVALG